MRFAHLKLRIGDMNLSTAGMYAGIGFQEMQKAQLGVDAGWLENDPGNLLPVTPGQI
jgi:hypothetical protein